MALFIGWTQRELYLALERANMHFGKNLCFDNDPTPQNQKDDRYRAILRVWNATRLRKKDLSNYPETLKKYEEANELLPDFLYPYGCTVSWNRGWNSEPRGIATMACWHAHGRFYRELFKINPNGQIRTALASYNGERGFNDKFPRTKYAQKGSKMAPEAMSERCCCEHHGIGDGWQ
jgi:hypothetical protein